MWQDVDKPRNLITKCHFTSIMAATPARNTQHAALVAVSDKIITSLSADPMDVAQTLFGREIIPQGLLDSMENKTKNECASELMCEVLKKVDNFSGNFDLFVEVLQERLWLEDTVKLIWETLEVSHPPPAPPTSLSCLYNAHLVAMLLDNRGRHLKLCCMQSLNPHSLVVDHIEM